MICQHKSGSKHLLKHYMLLVSGENLKSPIFMFVSYLQNLDLKKKNDT